MYMHEEQGNKGGRLLKNIFGCGARHIDLFRSSLSIRCGLTGTALGGRRREEILLPRKMLQKFLLTKKVSLICRWKRIFYPKGVINSDFAATTVTDRIELKRGECNKSD